MTDEATDFGFDAPVTRGRLEVIGFTVEDHNPLWERLRASVYVPELWTGVAVSVAKHGYVTLAQIDRFGQKRIIREGGDVRVRHVVMLCRILGILPESQ